MSQAWSALAAATECRVPRVPFSIEGRRVGSVAAAHRDALTRWPQWLAIDAEGVELCVPRAGRDAALVEINRALRQAQLVKAWRDEIFALPDPETGAVLATMERAAARFWGTLTLGAHATGFVRDPATGRPGWLWIAQRSPHKATDPGLFDNLIGGGVPASQSPAETLVREGFEEAGLPAVLVQAARAAGVLRLHRDIAEGFQHEWLHSFDLELPGGIEPVNQDGEVAGFALLPVAEAAALASGAAMTVDAALVTVDFLLRHDLLPERSSLLPRIEALRVVHGRCPGH
jgi:8-oxo-dGTP pyrophosphatase MutT (NUDIX family)